VRGNQLLPAEQDRGEKGVLGAKLRIIKGGKGKRKKGGESTLSKARGRKASISKGLGGRKKGGQSNRNTTNLGNYAMRAN